MSKVCFDCYNIGYIIGNNNRLICPKCYGENLRDIDDLLVGAIINFNEKGYETDFCCEGHLDNRNFYITFRNKIPNNMPNFLKKDNDNKTIRFGFSKNLFSQDFLNIRHSLCNSIYEWSKRVDENGNS